MACVPDRRLAITHKLKMLKTNKQIVLDALQQLMKIKHSNNADKEEAKKESETTVEENKPQAQVPEESECNTTSNTQETESKITEEIKPEASSSKIKDKVM